MKDEQKSRSQLVAELQALRQQLTHQEPLMAKSEQKEKTPWKSEEILRLVLDNIPQAVFWKNRDSIFLGCNRIFANDTGFADPHDVISKSDFDLSRSAEKANYFQEDDRQVMSSAKAVHHAIECIEKPDGSISWQDINKIPLLDENRAVIGLLVTYQDITERIQAEEATQESNEKLRTLLNATTDIAFLIDSKGVCLAVNHALAKHLGRRKEDLVGKCIFEFLSAEVGKSRMVNLQKVLESKKPFRWQDDDAGTYFDNSVYPILDANGNVKQAAVFAKDITDRTLAEIDLQKNALEWSAAMDTSEDALYLLDLDRHILRANKTFFLMTGSTPENCIGKHIVTIMHHEKNRIPCPVCLAQEEKRDALIVMEADHPDNPTKLPLEITLKMVKDDKDHPVSIFMKLHDLSKQRETENELRNHGERLEELVNTRTLQLKETHKQLLHSEKLSAIGRLSASIAHEFNNPLNGIQSVLEGVQGNSCLEQEDVNMVVLALKECERVRKLIRNLLDFNAPSLGKREDFNLQEALDTILSMCAKDLRNCSIRVHKEYVDDLPVIQAVPDQIKQVLLNLINNARDVMQESGGLLTLQTEQKDQQVVVHISDTGPGIDQENLGQIFEPFFTTKSVVKGTGLGLSISYGIIKNHGGWIDVESVPGKGATFSLFLPMKGERIMGQTTLQRLHVISIAFLLLIQFSLFFPATLVHGNTEAPELTKLRLQLKWYHQFQFAGFYAAQLKGFYRNEGLDVTLLEGGPGSQPLESVLSGRAEFGVLGSNLLFSRLQGKPLVALAAIFQHSPRILLSIKERRIRTLTDLAKEKIAIDIGNGDVEIKAIFKGETITLNGNQLVARATVQDLIDGKVAAMTAYLSNEPNLLAEQGLEAGIIRPTSYGVDFYGDMLFSTEQELEQYPERSAAFRRASLKGWQYAFDHQEELIDYILTLHGVQERGKNRKHLQYEAGQLRKLTHPDLIEVGHVNPQRMQQMAQTFVDLKMVDSTALLEGFIYNPDQNPHQFCYQSWAIAAIVLLTIFLMTMVVVIRKQRAVVRRKSKALQEQQQRYQNIFESVPASIVMVDECGKIVDINPHHINTIGKGKATREEYLGHNILTHPSIVCAGLSKLYERVLDGETINESSIYFPTLIGGDHGYFNTRGVPLFTDEGKVKGGIFFHENTTKLMQANKTIQEQRNTLEEQVAKRTLELQRKNETLQEEIGKRKAAEQDSQESEERLRALSEASFEAIFLSEKGVALEQNTAAELMFGYTLAEAIGKSATEWIVPTEPDRVSKKMLTVYAEPYKSVALRKDGSTFPCEIRGKMLSYQGREVRVTALRDVTEQNQAEVALVESHKEVAKKEALLQSIFKSAPIGINLAVNRKFYWTNEKLTEITGYSSEELSGQSARMLYLSDEEFERVGREIYSSIKECGTGSVDTRWQRKDGTILDIALCATTADMADLANGITFTTLDITQRKQAEKALAEYKEELEQRVAERTEALEKTHQQLLHSEKLSAIGRLSSSIAHEFNNPLNGIQSVLEGVQGSNGLEQEDVNMVAMALEECDRVRRLIRNLLDFNAPSADTREALNVHEVLDATLSMCSKELSSCSIQVHTEYGDKLPAIQVIPDQIKQVLLNLINNAKDAMQENGGLLSIVTEQEDQQVVVHISDTGSGIDPKDLDQIFEPFFTTKSAVTGTGLGLSISYGIVKGHGGDIKVKSAPGKGSTFFLYLPIEETLP